MGRGPETHRLWWWGVSVSGGVVVGVGEYWLIVRCVCACACVRARVCVCVCWRREGRGITLAATKLEFSVLQE